jgi:hypothetical protein
VIKVLGTGIWVIVVALASSYAAVIYKVQHPPVAASDEAATPQQSEKTRAISVPIIENGVVQGYIVTQLTYTIDPKLASKVTVAPEDFLLDEAFRRLYSDTSIDFHHLERYDIAKLKTDLIQATNARLGVNLIKNILIEDFNFVIKDDSNSK